MPPNAQVLSIVLDTMKEGKKTRDRFEPVQIGMTVQQMRALGLSGTDITTAIARERLTLSTGVPEGTITRSDVRVRALAKLRRGMTVADAVEIGVTETLLLRAINCDLIVLEAGEVLANGLPEEPPFTDEGAEGFEGEQGEHFVKHRKREHRLRDAKLQDALRRNGGRLVCEVPDCGFDFEERYGPIGQGYAQVHHMEPLGSAPEEGRRVTLDELAVVCANCHVMIHVGGDCRPLVDLIPRKPA